MTLAQIPNGNTSAGKPAHHIGGASPTGERNSRIWGAFIDHALVPQWASALPVRIPICIERGDGDAVIPSPFRAKSIRPIRSTLNDFGDEVLAVNGRKGASNKGSIPKITPTCDHDFHTEAYHFQAERATK